MLQTQVREGGPTWHRSVRRKTLYSLGLRQAIWNPTDSCTYRLTRLGCIYTVDTGIRCTISAEMSDIGNNVESLHHFPSMPCIGLPLSASVAMSDVSFFVIHRTSALSQPAEFTPCHPSTLSTGCRPVKRMTGHSATMTFASAMSSSFPGRES